MKFLVIWRHRDHIDTHRRFKRIWDKVIREGERQAQAAFYARKAEKEWSERKRFRE